MNDEAADFVIDAVAMVAEHGWKLLPQVCRVVLRVAIVEGRCALCVLGVCL